MIVMSPTFHHGGGVWRGIQTLHKRIPKKRQKNNVGIIVLPSARLELAFSVLRIATN
jgi:hypothetical protein